MNRIHIGSLIEIVDERNNDSAIDTFYGININKEFMPTIANTDEIDSKKYKVVRKNRFVFSGMQTGRDECIRIGLHTGEEPIIVSPAYTTFEIVKPNLILNEYFFMNFLSKEMDRYGWFLSDSSIRSNLDWDRFCEIEIDLPLLPIQQKYVDVYNTLSQNQKVYEKGLDDLKLTCDAYIERLRRELPHIAIGNYIKRFDVRNINNKIKNVLGISVYKKFRIPTSKVNTNELSNYKIVKPRQIGFVQTTHNEKVFAYAFNDTNDDIVISSVNEVFSTDENYLLPEFLSMFFSRTEFDRYARFHSWGSAREVFSFDDICDVKIPIPDIAVQQAIVNIFIIYNKRRVIVEKLKEQMKNICSILVKGAVGKAKCMNQ